MKVLVSGCSGFIGYSTCVRLLKLGHTVNGIDKARDVRFDKSPRMQNLKKFEGFAFYEANLANFQQTDTLLKLMDFDAVVHMAGQYSVAYNSQSMTDFCDGNIRSWLHIMDCAKRKGIKRVVYASSTFVDDGKMPNSMYGATLEFRERAANVYSSQFDMETVGLRFGSTYGPFMRPDAGIFSVCKRLFDDTPIDVTQGQFNYAVGFVYIADAVDCIQLSLEKPLEKKHNVFTVVANDRVRDMGEALRLMEKYSGKKAIEVGIMPIVPPGYTPTERLKPMEAALGYMPSTSFEVGLGKFVEWFSKRHADGKV